MQNGNPEPLDDFQLLVSEYEAINTKGTVPFLEKADFIRLVDHYTSGRLFEEALGVISHALRQYPFSEEFVLQKVELFLLQNAPQAALDCLETSPFFAPFDIEQIVLRVEAHIKLKQYEEAWELLSSLPGYLSAEERAEFFFCKALIYEAQDQFSSMFKALKKTLLINPKHEAALERIWFTVELCQKYEESIELHLKIIDEDPYSYLAWYNLGNAYTYIEDWEKAIEAFDYAIIINEHFEYAYHDYVAACMKAGKYRQAIKIFQTSEEIFQPSPELLVHIGLCHEALNEPEIALELYDRSILTNHSYAQAFYQKGLILETREKFDAAIYAFEHAVQIEDKNEDFLVALANTCFQAGYLEKADNAYQKATESAPEQADIWIQYALFLLIIDEHSKALEVTEESNAYFSHPALLYLKAAALFLCNLPKEGRIFLQQALEEDYNMHEWLFEIVPFLESDPSVCALINTFKV